MESVQTYVVQIRIDKEMIFSTYTVKFKIAISANGYESIDNPCLQRL